MTMRLAKNVRMPACLHPGLLLGTEASVRTPSSGRHFEMLLLAELRADFEVQTDFQPCDTPWVASACLLQA